MGAQDTMYCLFCRIRWESNDYGTTRWQLMVMQACTPLDAVQRIPGVRPGARLLLHAEWLGFNHPVTGLWSEFTSPCPF